MQTTATLSFTHLSPSQSPCLSSQVSVQAVLQCWSHTLIRPSASESQLARDLWPSGLGTLKLDVAQKKDLPAWRVVPADYEALCQWLYVDREESYSAPKVLVHPDYHDAAERGPVRTDSGGEQAIGYTID